MKINFQLTTVLIVLLSSNILAEGKIKNKLESYSDSIVSSGLKVSDLQETNSISEGSISKIKRPLKIKLDTNSRIVRRTESGENKSDRKLQKNLKSEVKIRPTFPEKSSQIDGFSFYSANSYLNLDLDGDGYFSDFTIEFDADFDGGYADVYAVLYYSKNGGPWVEYFETDVFEIYLNDGTDDYQVTSRLVNDFPTSDYDILVDLYEFGVTGIVATISSDETQNLLALPLEDEAHELNSNASQITYVASTISHDSDADQFYTDLTLEYDISTVYSGDVIYAEVILTNSDELWSQTIETDNFILGNQTEFIDISLNSGYPAGWYDVQINLINLYTGEVIANAAQDFASLAALKMESANNDNHYDSPSSNGGGVNSGAETRESGGGAISGYFLFLFFLISLYIRDIKNHSQRALQVKVKKVITNKH